MTDAAGGIHEGRAMPIDRSRFDEITGRYPALRVAVVGDVCLDRYLEIDPGREEMSIETGLPVHNVVRVRALPGGAGTIVNNLSALGAGEIHVVGFHGDDGEGYELRRALRRRRGVVLRHFRRTALRRTFTYCKPILVEPGAPPRELSRFDSKNWTPTPAAVAGRIVAAVEELVPRVDAMVLLDQVDVAETGVITRRVLDTVAEAAARRPELLVVADSRRGLAGFPPVLFKMNAAELASILGGPVATGPDGARRAAAELAAGNGRPVVVTLAEQGIVGATPDGATHHVPAHPVRGEIDIVGAGDAVTANLVLALAAGARLEEALELANAAASVVIHQLGTTGEATVAGLRVRLFGE